MIQTSPNTLESILDLPESWNGESTVKCSSLCVSRVNELLTLFSTYREPQVFPAGDGSIYLEFFNKENNKFLLVVVNHDIYEYILSGGEESPMKRSGIVDLKEIENLLKWMEI